jgi:isoleucyl-tRNA synthetase
VSQLLAPFCPFLADELYVALTGEESVHLSDWPVPIGAADGGLRTEMDAARQLVALGRAARTDAKVKVRQPLRRALLLHPGVSLSADVAREVSDELNVKSLEDVESLTDLISWTGVPNFRTLGPRLGPKVNQVKQALASADGSALKRQLDAQGWCEVAGERLSADDVEVRATQHDDFALAQEGAWAVALDLEIDEALRVEGVARELVRAVNDLRKEQGFDIADRVVLTIAGSERVEAALDAHGGDVAGEVLATEVRRQAGSTRLDLEPDWAEVTLDRS